MPDLSYRQKHRSRQHITGRVAVACDRTTHGWLDQWLANGDTYCKRAAWAWEIEQAAWPPTTINLRGVSLSLERGQLCHPLCFFEGSWGWSIGTVCWFLSGPGKRGTIRTDQNIGHCTVRAARLRPFQTYTGREQQSTTRSTPEKKLARPGTHRIAVLREHWAMVAGSCDTNDGDAGDAK
jgi:hypothetical protein